MDTNRKNYSDDHEQQRPIITFSQALATQLQYFDQVQRVYFWQENKLIQKQAAAYELQEQLDEACRRVEELECQKYLQRRNEQKLERQVEDYQRMFSYVDQESQKIGSCTESSYALTDLTATSHALDREDRSTVAAASGLLALTSMPTEEQDLPQKRRSFVIVDRHPEIPPGISVRCKQLSGVLRLDHAQLFVQIADGKTVTPSEFESLAGCGKGKNWKANMRIVGRNGKTQVLKMWLPGLLQLAGDHLKTAVPRNAHIDDLLNKSTGLRILGCSHTKIYR